MKQKLRVVKELIRKYQISLIASATSFYVIVALFSFSILAFQIYGLFSDDFENYLVSNIMEVINPLYQSIFQDFVPIFQLNSFSIFLFFSLSWSASKVINGLNAIADLVYKEEKRRKEFFNRLSSFFMFFMLVVIVFFEIGLILFANTYLMSYLKNATLIRLIQFIIEVSLIFITLSILYRYAPPIRMKFSDVLCGTCFATFCIYVSSIALIVVIQTYQRFNINYGVLTIISLFFFWIYVVNAIIALGIVLNYRYNGRNSHNKKEAIANNIEGYKKE